MEHGHGLCANCKYYDRDKQVCNHPKRDDSKNVFYYGRIAPDDYCTLFEVAEFLKPVKYEYIPCPCGTDYVGKDVRLEIDNDKKTIRAVLEEQDASNKSK